MDELLRWAAANGAPIGILGALVMVATVSQLFPRILGPVSQALYDFAKARRLAARDREDADIAEWRRQVAHLSATGKRKDQRMEALERHCWTHRGWELQAMDALPPTFPPPPPTFPPEGAADRS